MKQTKIALAVLAVVFGLMAALPRLIWRDAAAVGIIGSADGPTSILVSGFRLFAKAGVISALCAALCLMLCAIGWYGRNKA